MHKFNFCLCCAKLSLPPCKCRFQYFRLFSGKFLIGVVMCELWTVSEKQPDPLVTLLAGATNWIFISLIMKCTCWKHVCVYGDHTLWLLTYLMRCCCLVPNILFLILTTTTTTTPCCILWVLPSCPKVAHQGWEAIRRSRECNRQGVPYTGGTSSFTFMVLLLLRWHLSNLAYC